jgi:hypothetical protein
MPLEFDNTNTHCTALIEDVRYQSLVSEVVIITNNATHMSEAQVGGKSVPITEAEAESLLTRGARDDRHNTVAE